MDTAVHDRLIARFEPELQGLGYELVEVEFVPGPGGGTLRFYIDKPPEMGEGIDAEDCGPRTTGRTIGIGSSASSWSTR